MTYTGKTQVGSPPQTRDLGNLRVTKMAVGPLDNNAYLLQATDGSVLLIDAAAESDTLLTQLPDGRLEAVITTHSHGDHWGALGDVVAATGARTYAGAADAEAVGAQIAVPLSDGDHIDFGDATLTIIALRGHTPGGIAVHVSAADGANHIFSGDSLFPAALGAPRKRRSTNSSATSAPACSTGSTTRPGSTRARLGHHSGRRAPPPGRMARTRLVRPTELTTPLPPRERTTVAQWQPRALRLHHRPTSTVARRSPMPWDPSVRPASAPFPASSWRIT